VKNGLLVNWAMMPPGAVSAPRSCLATSGFDATSISRQRAAEAKTGGPSPPCMVNDVYRRMTISPVSLFSSSTCWRVLVTSDENRVESLLEIACQQSLHNYTSFDYDSAICLRANLIAALLTFS
jgi:hypothetical protein